MTMARFSNVAKLVGQRLGSEAPAVADTHTSLRDIFVVAELEHELVARLGILLDREAFLLRPFAEAVVGQRQSDYVERRLASTAPR